MNQSIHLIAREVLLCIASLELIKSFEVSAKNQFAVVLLDDEVVSLTSEDVIPFCRGLVEGLRISVSIIQKGDI